MKKYLILKINKLLKIIKIKLQNIISLKLNHKMNSSARNEKVGIESSLGNDDSLLMIDENKDDDVRLRGGPSGASVDGTVVSMQTLECDKDSIINKGDQLDSNNNNAPADYIETRARGAPGQTAIVQASSAKNTASESKLRANAATSGAPSEQDDYLQQAQYITSISPVVLEHKSSTEMEQGKQMDHIKVQQNGDSSKKQRHAAQPSRKVLQSKLEPSGAPSPRSSQPGGFAHSAGSPSAARHTSSSNKMMDPMDQINQAKFANQAAQLENPRSRVQLCDSQSRSPEGALQVPVTPLVNIGNAPLLAPDNAPQIPQSPHSIIQNVTIVNSLMNQEQLNNHEKNSRYSRNEPVDESIRSLQMASQRRGTQDSFQNMTKKDQTIAQFIMDSKSRQTKAKSRAPYQESDKKNYKLPLLQTKGGGNDSRLQSSSKVDEARDQRQFKDFSQQKVTTTTSRRHLLSEQNSEVQQATDAAVVVADHQFDLMSGANDGPERTEPIGKRYAPRMEQDSPQVGEPRHNTDIKIINRLKNRTVNTNPGSTALDVETQRENYMQQITNKVFRIGGERGPYDQRQTVQGLRYTNHTGTNGYSGVKEQFFGKPKLVKGMKMQIERSREQERRRLDSHNELTNTDFRGQVLGLNQSQLVRTRGFGINRYQNTMVQVNNLKNTLLYNDVETALKEEIKQAGYEDLGDERFKNMGVLIKSQAMKKASELQAERRLHEAFEQEKIRDKKTSISLMIEKSKIGKRHRNPAISSSTQPESPVSKSLQFNPLMMKRDSLEAAQAVQGSRNRYQGSAYTKVNQFNSQVPTDANTLAQSGKPYEDKENAVYSEMGRSVGGVLSSGQHGEFDARRLTMANDARGKITVANHTTHIDAFHSPYRDGPAKNQDRQRPRALAFATPDRPLEHHLRYSQLSPVDRMKLNKLADEGQGAAASALAKQPAPGKGKPTERDQLQQNSNEQQPRAQIQSSLDRVQNMNILHDSQLRAQSQAVWQAERRKASPQADPTSDRDTEIRSHNESDKRSDMFDGKHHDQLEMYHRYLQKAETDVLSDEVFRNQLDAQAAKQDSRLPGANEKSQIDTMSAAEDEAGVRANGYNKQEMLGLINKTLRNLELSFLQKKKENIKAHENKNFCFGSVNNPNHAQQLREQDAMQFKQLVKAIQQHYGKIDMSRANANMNMPRRATVMPTVNEHATLADKTMNNFERIVGTKYGSGALLKKVEYESPMLRKRKVVQGYKQEYQAQRREKQLEKVGNINFDSPAKEEAKADDPVKIKVDEVLSQFMTEPVDNREPASRKEERRQSIKILENPLGRPQQDEDIYVQANGAARQSMTGGQQLLATQSNENGYNNYPSLNQSSIELQEFYKSRDEQWAKSMLSKEYQNVLGRKKFHIVAQVDQMIEDRHKARTEKKIGAKVRDSQSGLAQQSRNYDSIKVEETACTDPTITVQDFKKQPTRLQQIKVKPFKSADLRRRIAILREILLEDELRRVQKAKIERELLSRKAQGQQGALPELNKGNVDKEKGEQNKGCPFKFKAKQFIRRLRGMDREDPDLDLPYEEPPGPCGHETYEDEDDHEARLCLFKAWYGNYHAYLQEKDACICGLRDAAAIAADPEGHNRKPCPSSQHIKITEPELYQTFTKLMQSTNPQQDGFKGPVSHVLRHMRDFVRQLKPSGGQETWLMDALVNEYGCRDLVLYNKRLLHRSLSESGSDGQ